MSDAFTTGFSGAMSGASAGAKLGGAPGALVGGALGGITGIVGGLYSDKQRRRAIDAANSELNNWKASAESILKKNYDNRTILTGDDDVKNYKNLRDNYDPSQFVLPEELIGSFDKSKYRVEEYLNPNKDAILNDIGKSVQHTAAGSALGHSSGTLSSIVAQQMAKDEELYKDARSAMESDRNFDYGMYTDYIKQQQERLNAMQSGVTNKISMLGGDIKFDQQNEDNYTSNRLNLGNTIAQSKANLYV